MKEGVKGEYKVVQDDDNSRRGFYIKITSVPREWEGGPILTLVCV